MNQSKRTPNFENLLRQRPHAFASIHGSELYPDIRGSARFYETPYGTLVTVHVNGLPKSERCCQSPIFALHIHEGGSCTGNREDHFANVGMHYDPHGCAHPYHAGDLPPLFGADGHAFSVFLSDRFTVNEVIGRAIIIHSSPDDFVTQPSGNSGQKIACGEIMGRKR